MGSGLPSWRGLLERIGSGRQGVAVERLMRHGLDLPAVAALLERQFADREQFVEAVRSELYRDFPFFSVDGPRRAPERRDLIAHVETRNTTLQALGRLCVIGDEERGYLPNPRVRGIVSFNLDHLLQSYLRARYRNHKLIRTIERPSASAVPGATPIYHVHGLLRFDHKAGNRQKEAPDSMVLTEHDYFAVFNDPTSIFNYTLLFLLRETSFLFVGLSMTDHNLRRLLYYSRQERAEAYRAEGSPERAETDVVRHFAVLPRPRDEATAATLESSLRNLGVCTLFVRRFRQLNRRLGELHRAGLELGDTS